MEPIKLEILLSDLTRAGMQSVKGNLEEIKQYTSSVVSLLEKELADMQTKAKQAAAQDMVSPNQLADIQAMTGVVNGLKEELAELEKQKRKTDETPIMQNDPAPKLNSVKMSMAQIARELPSLAMGPQMFFLAISNNIPMFTDAVAQARREHDLLVASNQKATPVWKQLLSSLFSWQTAMAAGITLSVVYGKEIGGWISQLWKGKEAALSMTDVQHKMNESLQTADLGKQVVTVRSLQERWSKLGDNLQDKKKFITDNKDEFDKLGVAVNNIGDAENLLVANTSAFIEAMGLRAEAAAAFKLATEEAEKAIKKQKELDKKKEQGPTTWDKFLANLSATAPGTVAPTSVKEAPTAQQRNENKIKRLDEERQAAEDASKSYITLHNARLQAAADKLKEAGIKENKKDDKPKPATAGKSALDYQNELADARIRAQQKLEAARIAIMKDGYDKRAELARQEREKELARIDKDERDTLLKMQQAKQRGAKITPEQEQAVKSNATDQRLAVEVKYGQTRYDIDREWREKNRQAWIDYNKEYGTWQEKRLAITQDYALKIGKATTDGEKAALAKEKDKEVKALNFAELEQSIDFEKLFGNLDRVSTDMLEELRAKLKEYLATMNSELTPENLKEVMDAFADLDLKIADRTPVAGLKSGYDDYKSALKEVAQAERELQDVQQGREVIVGWYMDNTDKLVKKLLTQAEAEKRLMNAQDGRHDALNRITQSANSLGEKGQQVVGAGNDLVDMLTHLGISVPESVAGALAGLGQITASLASIDATKPLSIVTGITGTLAGVAQTVGSIFGLGGDSQATQVFNDMKEQLEGINEIYEKMIANSKEDIIFGGGFASIEAANNALDTYAKKVENYRKLAAAGGEAGGSTGSRRYATRANKRLSGLWGELSKAIGQNISSVQQMYDLTGEQLYIIQTKFPEAWQKIPSEITDSLNAIIECKDEAQELADALNAAMTGIDTDGFYNGFIDGLSDMDTSFEDMCDNFEDYLRKSIIAGLVASQYQDRIDGLYQQWSDAAKSDGKITKEESDRLKEEYQQIVKDMMADRDQMGKDFGWNTSSPSQSSQSGHAGAVTTVTEETAGKLEGIGNASLDRLVRIDENTFELTTNLSAMAGALNIIAENSEYLKKLEEINDGIASLNLGIKMK